jgi:hypothetical protein
LAKKPKHPAVAVSPNILAAVAVAAEAAAEAAAAAEANPGKDRTAAAARMPDLVAPAAGPRAGETTGTPTPHPRAMTVTTTATIAARPSVWSTTTTGADRWLAGIGRRSITRIGDEGGTHPPAELRSGGEKKELGAWGMNGWVRFIIIIIIIRNGASEAFSFLFPGTWE